MAYAQVQPSDGGAFGENMRLVKDNGVRLSAHEADRPKRSQNDGRSRFFGAPVEMGILVVVGFLGALGHLLFYHFLDGKPVLSTALSQEWTFRIGSVLAFVTKTCWTITVIVAHAQQAWIAIERKSPDLKTIDALFSSVSDFTSFRHWSMIRTAKVATILAIVAWCIPLSTIVTPSTLTVVSAPRMASRTVDETVPMVAFSNASRFAAVASCTVGLCPVSLNPTDATSAIQFRYPNAQTAVLSAATFSSGRIQAMVPQHSNSSYRVNFYAPVLDCEEADADTVKDMDKVDSQTAPDDSVFDNSGSPAVSYYAFVPASMPNGTLTALDFAQLPTGWDMLENATLPETLDIWIKAGEYQNEGHTVCGLYNASYDAEFSFVNGAQTTEVTVSRANKVPYTIALGAPDNEMEPWGFEFQRFTYQAIWMSLAQQVIGRFYNSPFSDTRVLQTPIVGSREFAYYFSYNFGAAEQPFASDKSIGDIVEEMSQNITLSLFSSSVHRTAEGTEATITVWDSSNVYKFNMTTLLVSYVVTLAVTLACICAGLLAYLQNGGSRSLTYSAMVEAAKDSSTTISLGSRH